MVQTFGLVILVRGSGETDRHTNADRHSVDSVQGSPRFPG
jgi:hypothetical protein